MKLLPLLVFLLLPFSVHAETVNVKENHKARVYGYRVEKDGLRPLAARPVFIFGTTYYVRNDGSPSCNGLVDAPYPGSGTNQPCAFLSIEYARSIAQTGDVVVIVVPAGGNLQAAINAAKFGDTIQLEAGATFKTGGTFTGFNLTDKGTPTSAARDCGSERILITTTDPSGTPAALMNYPAQKIRPTPTMAARMPKVVASGSVPAIWINPGAKCWVVERLEITSVPGANSIRLIGTGENNPRTLAEYPDRNTFRYNWIHPAEEVGQPATAADLNRSAESAFYLEGTRFDIHNNAMTGFIRRYPDGNVAAPSCLLITTWGDDVNFNNNLCEAWTYSWFIGGGSKNIAHPENTGTVSNCNATSCDFSNTTGITVGKAIAILVYTYTDSIGIVREVWGTGRTLSISGSRVTFEKPLCWGDNDEYGNTCKPFDPANSPKNLPTNGIPPNGAQARWGGLQPQRIFLRRNLVSHPPEWGPLMNNNCGGKGYYELKACKDCAIEGNIFSGCTGGTLTARNQGGPDPWNNVDNLSTSFNWFQEGNNTMVAYLNDSANLTQRSKNVRFHNNLVEKVFVNLDDFQYLQVVSGVFSGGENTNFTHNTILMGKYMAFSSYADPQSRMLGLGIRDNIFLAAPNACYTDGAGTAGAPITACWPNADVRGNVLIKTPTRTTEELQDSWFKPYPNNVLVPSQDAVGFVGGTSQLDRFKLATTSPHKGKATDGSDPGADMEQLKQAIFGTTTPPLPPLPSPTPTVPVPSPTATPIPSPTVTPTPQPQPSPQPTATPQPSPVPTPTPTIPEGQIVLSGSTFSAFDGGPFKWTVIVLSDASGKEIRRLQEQESSYRFVVPPGTYQIHVEQEGWNTSPSRIYISDATETMGGLTILNFTVGPSSWFAPGAPHCMPGGGACPPGQPLPSPTATPTPSPSPIVTPTPQPSPSPTPTPTPTPTPVPTPTPEPPSCSISVPDSVTMARNSTASIMVTVNAGTTPLPIVVTAIAGTGQVVVTPTRRNATAVNSQLPFILRTKQNPSSVRWESVCGVKVTQVLIR